MAGSAAVCLAVARATTLVAVWSPTELLLAADSAVTRTNGAVLVRGNACKIGQESEASYFALSGLVDDRVSAYNADQLAHDAIALGGTLEQRVGRFINLASGPLAKAVDSVKRESPAQYEFLRQGHPALQAIFADVEKGPASLAVAQINIGPDGSLVPSAQMIAAGDDGRGPRIIYAGAQRHIRDYLDNHDDWSSEDQTALVRKLVELEIGHSSGEVRGPVDIVRITPNAADWVQRKPECGARAGAAAAQ
jgi:hypothetical protein